jgi:AraC family transcriptional regulator
MLNTDPTFARARSPGDRNLRPRGLDGDTELMDSSDSEDTDDIPDVDMDEPGRRPLQRLHLAVAEIFNALSSALKEEWRTAEECALRASSILSGPSLFPQAGVLVTLKQNKPPIQIRGGLAPWQVRQVARYIESNLETPIQTGHLAALVKLSPFHFCRAFRSSFDDSPHGYVMRRRVERAQGLLLTTNAPLAQIAVECGMADQAHFNKLFRRFVGDSPGAWRRARVIANPGTLPTDDSSEDSPESAKRYVIPPLGASLRSPNSCEVRAPR